MEAGPSLQATNSPAVTVRVPQHFSRDSAGEFANKKRDIFAGLYSLILIMLWMCFGHGCSFLGSSLDGQASCGNFGSHRFDFVHSFLSPKGFVHSGPGTNSAT